MAWPNSTPPFDFAQGRFLSMGRSDALCRTPGILTNNRFLALRRVLSRSARSDSRSTRFACSAHRPTRSLILQMNHAELIRNGGRFRLKRRRAHAKAQSRKEEFGIPLRA